MTDVAKPDLIVDLAAGRERMTCHICGGPMEWSTATTQAPAKYLRCAQCFAVRQTTCDYSSREHAIGSDLSPEEAEVFDLVREGA